MKTYILIAAFALCTGYAHAQKLKAAEVPAAVKENFQKQYPSVTVVDWEKEDGNFEAEFEVGETETSVVYEASGKLIMTETEIAVSELPKAVGEYLAKNLPGQKIKEAAKMTDASGTITYEAEVDKADYIFDASGNFIKKEVE
ncbi:MAG: PepSY-like domain-containing protein [Bacteroidota bacterium]|nr:PepSY-like domain-containing protein [Bacteroidota bacterium]